MSGDVIKVFGLEEVEGDRASFRRAEDFRYGRSEIPVDEFRLRAGEYDLAEVQVTVEVSAKGKVSLLGTGGEPAGRGAMTFVFRRTP